MIQLADRYQVSQMPIREALQSLQGEGLVELEAKDYPKALQFNRQFHRLINGQADNNGVMRIIDKQRELIHALHRRYSFGTERLKEIVQEHWLLVEALRVRDEEPVTTIALKHSQHAKDDPLKQMQELPQEG